MKQYFFSILFLTSSILVSAQTGKTTLEVDKRYHDFGKIKEDGGKVRAVFTFKNTGNANLVILKAEPSCGCTVGEWTKEPIPPGKIGTVTAVFNPNNLLGIIDKTVGVYTNALYSSVVVLELRGEVIPRDKAMSDIFPYRIGNLMFDKEMIELGDVLHNGNDSAYIVMYNDGQYPIKINNITSLPKGFSVRPEKNSIDPGQEVRLYSSVEGNTLNDFGPFNKNFKLITDDAEYSEKPLYIFGNLKYNFGKLSKSELKNAPKIVLDNTSKDFGEHAVGSFVDGIFKITNKGKDELKILSIKAQCSCTVSSIDKTTIQEGETVILKIKFDLVGHAGNVQKLITLYTNDPKNPTVDIQLKAKLY